MPGTITAQPAGTPIAVDFLNGVAVPKAARQDKWQQAGIAGFGAHILADGDSKFYFRLVKFTATAVDREAWKDSIFALKKSLVTIVDDEGITHANLLIDGFSQPIQYPVLKDGSPTVTRRCELIVTGEKTVP